MSDIKNKIENIFLLYINHHLINRKNYILMRFLFVFFSLGCIMDLFMRYIVMVLSYTSI